MATQIFGKDHAVMMPRPAAQDNAEAQEPRGGAIRGFMYAMLFNVFLLAAAFGAWELWRAIFR